MPPRPACDTSSSHQGAGTIRVGVGGWTFEPWRGTFYPKGLAKTRELTHASRALTTIEINGTFYRTQTPKTFAKWRDETPEGFVFAVKALQYATHRGVLAEAGSSVTRFLGSGLSELGPKLGPILWQFLPSKKFDRDDMAAFLDLLPAEIDGLRLRHALEVRHASFRDPAFVALCRARGAAIVVPGDSDHPQIADPTADFVYARIMGTREGEAQGYAPREIDAWAERARLWASGGAPDELARVETSATPATPRDVFLYVISGHKAANPAAAMALIERLGGAANDPAKGGAEPAATRATPRRTRAKSA